MKQVKMIAHRGLSAREQENTARAFVAAGNRSFYGIETDARRTKDGVYVLLHDDSTVRVAPHETAHIVEQSDYPTLAALMYDDLDGVQRPDLRMPRLCDYLTICNTYQKVSVLEIKELHTEEELCVLLDEVTAIRPLEQMVFISFHRDNCVRLRKLLPQQNIQWLVGEYNDAVRNTLLTYRLGLDIYYPALTKEAVDELHAHGLEVNCWTCDDPAEAKKLIAMGVDYITTDILE